MYHEPHLPDEFFFFLIVPTLKRITAQLAYIPDHRRTTLHVFAYSTYALKLYEKCVIVYGKELGKDWTLKPGEAKTKRERSSALGMYFATLGHSFFYYSVHHYQLCSELLCLVYGLGLQYKIASPLCTCTELQERCFGTFKRK